MMSVRDLLFEIGTEEIPASFLSFGLEEIKRLAREELEGAGLKYGGIESYGTPRRLTLYVRSLNERQDDVEEEVRGPLWSQAFDSNGYPTKVALGFAKSRGVGVESLQMREVRGAAYAFAVVRREGRKTFDLLPEMLQRLLKRLIFPKNMYWSDPSVRFARPIRWLVALWGSDVIPVSVGNVRSDRVSRGHRFLGKRSIEIPSAGDYLKLLYSEFVIAHPEKRREKMLSAVAALEKEMGARVELDKDLVEENVNLVEYPVPFYGTFDQSYLDIPEEVLTTTMKKHQRYFPVRDRDGKLVNFFVGISNNQATVMQNVRDGNERVLRARLSDAAFFWEEDRKKGLASRVEDLKAVVYQEKLGSLYQKVESIRELALWLTDHLGLGDKRNLVDRAAFLSKADLVTSMVYEFPELQGVMGREYARCGGEHPEVALALYEQYLPRFAGDQLPKGVVGAIIGLAERAYTIVAIHHVGLEPTASQDPHGLRRASRCINEIIWGLNLDVSMDLLFRKAAEILGSDEKVLDRAFDFFRQRLVVQLKERDFSHGLVGLAVDCIGRRPLQALKLIEVLDGLKEEDWFSNLVTAAIRVRNILVKAKDEVIGEDLSGAEGVELELLEELKMVRPLVEGALSSFDWHEMARLLHRLEGPISRFFDGVMVMDQDLSVRARRLGILREAQGLFDLIGDFTKLKGEVR
ncbi:glycyl-tRNA synthetase, tetrameric type, beta subunit [Thermanaerovibrio velox DSM 12556]|uniref:Glycine--tRNA ligase beta subunit n=1 Tax=Thermanaerovibrio velox DSM 12556 TaxID=926567 RepID=H0URD3_9BACT|nr:glycyl-tRNA synthetase, tetrameric type, beta subunit [Thermanaerovibrio velox DSM 12556]